MCVGDNKSRGMLAFCMMLVKQKVAREVCLSMLICGHTHCDIDQVRPPPHWAAIASTPTTGACLQWFSIPARHYKMVASLLPTLQTPQQMIDEWLKAFKHIDPPAICFVSPPNTKAHRCQGPTKDCVCRSISCSTTNGILGLM